MYNRVGCRILRRLNSDNYNLALLSFRELDTCNSCPHRWSVREMRPKQIIVVLDGIDWILGMQSSSIDAMFDLIVKGLADLL